MLRILDLFSGAGGFALGFHLEGFDVSTHVEIDRFASKTLEKNFPNSRVITDDIRFLEPVTVVGAETIDIIIGGPPCQGFSVAGSTQFGIEDNRNELIFWYLKYVQILKPKIAIIENVPNVLNKKNTDGTTFLDLIKKISLEMGYNVSYQVLNSANFGVPQSRRRAFIVLHSSQYKFQFPEITHGDREENQLFSFINKTVSVGEALLDLPDVDVCEVGSGLSYNHEPTNSFQVYCRERSTEVFNHDPMKHTDRVVERFKIIGPGQSLKDVPLSHGQIAYGSGETVKKPFKYNNYRLDPAKHSLAIPASFQSLFVHPVKNRNLTAREGARLMSFPDWYQFEGPKTMMSWETGLSQYNQIGNSVCPLVAKSLAKSVRSYLKELGDVKVQVNISSTLKKIHENLSCYRYTMTDAKNASETYSPSVALSPSTLMASKYYNEQKKCFVVNTVNVSIEKVQIAFDLLHSEKCKICNYHEPPFGNHKGSMNLLISKSDIQSLVGNAKDHGLDFHIRIITSEDGRYANEIATILQDIGVANIQSSQNPRTGKSVKSITLNMHPL